MLQRAELNHIKRLHHIGRQLAVLKRVYQSYENIIEQLLQRQEATLASLKNSHILSGEGTGSLSSSQPQLAGSESLLGVSLSSAARQRFERLRDRIKLYVLSEIQECLDQKESLVMMVSKPTCTLDAIIVRKHKISTPLLPAKKPSRGFNRNTDAVHKIIRISISSPSKNPIPSNVSLA